ncbi:hypothetical protein [Nocardiopsis alba]|uniref:hypothetical protein n=1 Tax=Nocardiopsis alba TaxID=53437 RepID=UPI0033FB533D
MQDQILELSTTAATTLVKAMVTDGWPKVRDGVAGLFGRRRKDEQEQIRDELDRARDELCAVEAERAEEESADLRTEWRARLGRLLRSRPDLADELRAILADLDPWEEEESDGIHHNTFHGPTAFKVGGSGDQHNTFGG